MFNIRKEYALMNATIGLLAKAGATKRAINEATKGIKFNLRYDRDHNHPDPLDEAIWKYGTIGFDGKRHLEDFDDSCNRYMWYALDYVVDDADEFVKENWSHWYNPYGDGRDCTGVWFTTYMHVVPIPAAGITHVIEYQAMDV